MIPLEEYVQSGGRLIVAHRGSSGTAPENTMAAYKLALDAGVQMIETDVQFSSDDYAIAFHDAELERTSSGSGLTGDKKFNELKELDAGAWFDRKFSGERIPLLQELIDLIKGRAYLNIEIKSWRSGAVDKKISKLLEIIFSSELVDYTLISSFDHKLLAKIKTIDSGLHTAAIKIPGDKRLPSLITSEIGAGAFVCSYEEVNSEIVNDAVNNGIYVGVYSIDTPEQLEQIQKYNIRSIVTNYPARIINLLSK